MPGMTSDLAWLLGALNSPPHREANWNEVVKVCYAYAYVSFIVACFDCTNGTLKCHSLEPRLQEVWQNGI